MLPEPENKNARQRQEPPTGIALLGCEQLSGNVLVPGRRGWVCLYRRLIDHPRYKDSEFVHVWVHLLLNATHKPVRAVFAGREIILQPGQLITGRHSIARETAVHESKVKRVLTQLKTDQQIDQQTSNTSSLISIINWHLYQPSGQPIDQQMTSQSPASDQPVTTNNIEKLTHLAQIARAPTK